MTSTASALRIARRSISSRLGRRAAFVLAAASGMAALWNAESAMAIQNSFNDGSTSSQDWTDPTNWSLGAVPNDPTQEIVIPPTAGLATGATTMTFNSGNIVAGVISDVGNPGRVLLNTGGNASTITLDGIADKPTILMQPTGAFQFSIGTSSVSNNINLVLGAGTNEFRNALTGSNVMRIYANISQVNPGTNVTITSTTGNGSLILGGSNSFSGALNLDVGMASLDYSQMNAPLVASTGSLVLDGGTIILQGSAAGNTHQTVAMTSFNAGTTQFIFNANNGLNSSINLGALSRAPGGAANIVVAQGSNGFPTSVQTSSPNVNGILGGWITTQSNTIGPGAPNNNNYDWATNSGGNIVPFTAYDTIDNEGSWTTNANINNDAAFTGSVGTLTINSLRTNAAGSYTVNTTGLLTIASGGILAQGTFAAAGAAAPETLSFSGTGAVTSGTTDLIITGPGSAKTVVFAIPIQDNGAQSVGITKNVGTVVILGSDTYSGNVYVNTGSLNIDTVANTGQPSSLGTSGTIFLGTVGDTGTLNFGSLGTATLGGSTDRSFVLGPSGGIIRNIGTGANAIILTGPITGGSFSRFGTGGTTRILGTKTFAGSVTVGAGSLEVDSIANIGTPSSLGTGTIDPSITLGSATAGGGTLSYIGTADATTNRNINLGTMGGSIRVANAVNLTVSGAIANLSVSTAAFSLDKFGVGTLIIPGAQNYQGTLTIDVGALSVNTIANKGVKSGLGIGTEVVSNGTGTLDVSTITLGGSSAVGMLSYTGTGSASTDRAFKVATSSFNNNGGAIESTSSTLTLNGGIELNKESIAFSGAGAVNVAGAIVSTGGTGIVSKTGTGTLVLANVSNSYAGGTSIGGGYVTIDSDPELGALTGSVTLIGGTLLTTNSINSARSFVIGASGGAFDTGAFNSTLTGTIAGSGNFTKGGTAVLTTNGINAGLIVNAGTFAVAQGRDVVNKLSNVTNLSVTPGAAIDLNDNDLIYNYSNGGAASAAKLGQVQQLLASGYAGGAWTGTGITSSKAASVASAGAAHKTALGYAEASTTGQATFDGVTIDNDMLLVRYTYYGDTNLDGVVNTTDFNNLAAHFNQSASNWVSGDFNYDGVVNASDFALLASNYGAAAITAPPALGTLVPEPLSLGMFGLCATLLSTRRRRA